MSLVESFSLGSSASARYPIANSVPTSEAAAADNQDGKKLFYEVKHLRAPALDTPPSIRFFGCAALAIFMSDCDLPRVSPLNSKLNISMVDTPSSD
jgi:hypothetical protein